MDPQREIATMPGPQWLFGFDISESQRLRFARLYLEFAASDPDIPVHLRSSATLAAFVDRCNRLGLHPIVRRESAIDILRRPNFFGWTPAMRGTESPHVSLRSKAATERARDILDDSRARLRRARQPIESGR